MATALTNLIRLARAGIVLAEHGVGLVPKGERVPWPLRLANLATLPVRIVRWPFTFWRRRTAGNAPVAAALTRLGPSYIKLGQFLASRPDLIDKATAKDLATLQDRLPPFGMAEARQTIEIELGARWDRIYAELGPPVAAASIAQVHKGVVVEGDERRPVAVKILRPHIERRFAHDLESFAFAAREIERWLPFSRRLRPVAVVETLRRSVELEMDLRLEAAAVSEMGENIARHRDPGFRVPNVDWKRTAKRVLTLEWVEGVPVSDLARLEAAGHDLERLGNTVIQSFLRHAMRDGFFHADMHQGNLFVDAEGKIVAVDFGIVGRLGSRERRFLAEILNGFINRDYLRAAEVHFWAGYVPPHHRIETFAQALRAIGEPIQGRPAEEISMASLLGQLLEYTQVFDMQTRPELILLQKTMVVVEGVARSLHPALNMWTCAAPVVAEWMERELGPPGRLREAGEGAQSLANFLSEVPGLLSGAETALRSVMAMAEGGVRLSPETVAALAAERGRWGRWSRVALWLAALSLAAIAGVMAWGWWAQR
jgi:ubiquinone biosynthesis protein